MREIDALEFWQAQGSAYFCELSTFGALPETVVLELLQAGRVLALDAGEHLYEVGERSDAFYIVLTGQMKSYMPRSDGGWTLARCHDPGDDMGFVPMIALLARPAFAMAVEDAVVLEITSGHFLDLQQQKPDAFGLMLLNLVRGTARAFINMASTLAEQDYELHHSYQKGH
ncbi:cyclic nucleotide-binding domain-containing protein [Marinobacter bohaiensis]|uniref:cyclic nucleotide-binding domain-containing protein n=1 Tax=Marinobacter bohaiensis TaxID=2201898 RepID=UPI0013A6E098|nr:cyclic nucleotide-binding domain-containing protein [Marinobacter bohaiensis]